MGFVGVSNSSGQSDGVLAALCPRLCNILLSVCSGFWKAAVRGRGGDREPAAAWLLAPCGPNRHWAGGNTQMTLMKLIQNITVTQNVYQPLRYQFVHIYIIFIYYKNMWILYFFSFKTFFFFKYIFIFLYIYMYGNYFFLFNAYIRKHIKIKKHFFIHIYFFSYIGLYGKKKKCFLHLKEKNYQHLCQNVCNMN